MDPQGSLTISAEDRGRAGAWRLLGRLLSAPPSASFLEDIAVLKGDDTPFGRALSTLAAEAKAVTPESVDDEFHALFIGVTRGELVPYGSYYQTGFLNEKPLAALRADMRRLGIVQDGDVREPEDHVAALCDMMAGLILGEFKAPPCASVSAEFFRTHLDSWIDVFFSDLEGAEHARFYAPVGALGLALVDIERTAFSMLDERSLAARAET